MEVEKARYLHSVAIRLGGENSRFIGVVFCYFGPRRSSRHVLQDTAYDLYASSVLGHVLGPVKTWERARSKVRDKAKRKGVTEMEIASSLYDVVRGSILADDCLTLAMAVLALASRADVEVLRIKNGFGAAGRSHFLVSSSSAVQLPPAQ